MKIDIPVLAETDVLVLGGTTGAVAAAVAARQAGRRVFCVAGRAYLGEDVCAILNYWEQGGAEAGAPRTGSFFPATQDGRLTPPMQIKLRLEKELVAAGVDYLYMSYPVRWLTDARGAVAGVVVANRSGFQAIKATVVIDATERAGLARQLPGATFRPFVPGSCTVRRITLGNDTAATARKAGRRLEGFFCSRERDLIAHGWTLAAQLPDTSPAALAKVDTDTRLLTWHAGQLVATEHPDIAFADTLKTDGRRQETWTGADAFDLGALQCGKAPVFVLGPLADVGEAVAAALRDPDALTALGRRLGAHAAGLAAPAAGEVRVDDAAFAPVTGLDVVRKDRYFRATDAKGSVAFDLNRLPVLGEYDVVVVGGGTAGAPAGIAAARAGARTVILEYLPGLGGVATEGRIASYYHGNRCGFTSEIDWGAACVGRAPDFRANDGSWNTEWKKHWYLRTARDAGAEVWFGALTVAAAVRDGNRVCGVVVATPYGFGLVKAGAVVDGTGNADVAAAAGAETVNISNSHVAVQGTGLSPFNPGQHYANTDHTFVDDTDVLDVTRAFSVARAKFSQAFDLAQIVNSRQRQQVRGELSLDPLDFLAGRTFPDTITTAKSNFDSHGFTIHPVFMAKAPDRESLSAHVPYRCLLPVGLDGILVTGLGVSAHRDALPVIRMQPDVQNQGYAAGRAAAMAVQAGCGVRGVDIKALQRHLVDIRILTPDVPGHTDSFPLPDAKVAEAVKNGTDDYLGLAVIFANPDRSLPLLRAAYAKARGARRLRLAHLLGLLGDDTGVDTLAAAVEAKDWDTGWNYTGMGQFGFSLSEMDSMLVALGRTRNPRALPALLGKLNSLGADREFSHFRALTLAFEALPAPEAAPRFAFFLDAFRGQSKAELAAAVRQVPADGCDTSERNRELRELLIARGLFACGDLDGKGRAVLEAYRKDLHGHYARHARALLDAAG